MEAPQNLVDAVNRIKPRATLLLDTNTIMRPPRLESYEINAEGPFLLVVPHLMAGVGGELISIELGNEGKAKGEMASRARKYLGKLYERGDPKAGIDLGNGRWLITVYTPKPDRNDLEDQRARRNLGPVDSALLRLARACVEDNLDTATLLITHDKPLTRHAAKAGGLSVCQLRDLRVQEKLAKILIDASPGRRLAPQDPFEKFINFDEERIVKIGMTLEELQSDRDYLIARGSGRLTDGEERYPFRWTFPYQNLAIYNLLRDDVPISTESAVMPLENVDFMGADDKIQEEVRRYICSMLEDAYESKDLQSPITKVRASMLFYTHMGITKGGVTFDYPLSDKQKKGKKKKKVKRYEELRINHNRHVKSLYDGSAKSISEAYRSAFQLNEGLDSFWDGFVDDEYDGDNWNVELSLMWFLDEALSAWTVGETREAEYAYRPFAWPEDDAEAVDDDEGDLEEEIFVDEEDDSEEEIP